MSAATQTDDDLAALGNLPPDRELAAVVTFMAKRYAGSHCIGWGSR